MDLEPCVLNIMMENHVRKQDRMIGWKSQSNLVQKHQAHLEVWTHFFACWELFCRVSNPFLSERMTMSVVS